MEVVSDEGAPLDDAIAGIVGVKGVRLYAFFSVALAEVRSEEAAEAAATSRTPSSRTS